MHYVVKCEEHGTIYSQCRCPDKNRSVSTVPCNPEWCGYTPGSLVPLAEEEKKEK